jgi:hypothetical protein
MKVDDVDRQSEPAIHPFIVKYWQQCFLVAFLLGCAVGIFCGVFWLF